MRFRRPLQIAPPSVTREIDEELAAHLRLRADDLVRGGASEADAYRQALAEFGDLSAARSDLVVIDARVDARRDRASWWSGVGRDLHLGGRRLIAQPVRGGVMVLTLALAIGAGTAVFSVVDQTVLRPAPFRDANRLVDIFEADKQGSGGSNTLTPTKIARWQGESAIFERLEGYAARDVDLAGTGEPERLPGRFVTLGLFDMLGVAPLLGRGFGPGDGATWSERVVIIGEGLWHRRFGGDPAAIGMRLTLNDRAYTVVGVMPRRFRLLGPNEDVWLPVDVTSSDSNTDDFYGVARLARGIPLRRAQEDVDAVAERLQRDAPMARGWYLLLERKHVAQVDEAARQILLVLLGAVGCLVLIACANVTALRLGQSSRRSREVGLRSALGASRARLLQEALAEGLVLAAAGGTLGWLFAQWLVDAVVSAAPANLAFMATSGITLDGRVLVVTALVTCGCGLLCGLGPAFRVSRQASIGPVRDGVRTTGSATNLGRGHGLLVAAEIACSVVLLIGALLMARTMTKVYALDPGFKPAGLITMHVDLPDDRYPTAASRQAFLADLAIQVRRAPGVSGVAITTGVPPVMGGFTVGVADAEGGAQGQSPIMIPSDRVSASYFETVGIPLLAGRAFTPDDPDDVVIVSASLARQFWPDAWALGRRFRLRGVGRWRAVVGIVGQVEAHAAGNRRTALQMYFPWEARSASTTPVSRAPGLERAYTYQMLVVRADRPVDASAAIKTAIWRVDSRQPVEHVALVTDLYADAFGRERFVFLLMAVFSATALALSTAGLFGLLSQAVTEHRREIGVRVALGAAPRDIARLIMGRGLALTLAGVTVGLATGASVTQYLRSVLVAVGPYDALSFGSVAVILVAVAAVACWLPAQTALRLDPAQTLRGD